MSEKGHTTPNSFSNAADPNQIVSSPASISQIFNFLGKMGFINPVAAELMAEFAPYTIYNPYNEDEESTNQTKEKTVNFFEKLKNAIEKVQEYRGEDLSADVGNFAIDKTEGKMHIEIPSDIVNLLKHSWRVISINPNGSGIFEIDLNDENLTINALMELAEALETAETLEQENKKTSQKNPENTSKPCDIELVHEEGKRVLKCAEPPTPKF